MNKKSLILISTFLLIGFVSAYGSLQDVLNEIDPSTAILGSMFLIILFASNFALSRVFKGQKGVAGIVSAIIAFMAIYTINRSGWDYQNIYYGIFSGIGLPSEVASTVLPLIILAAAVFIVIKTNFATLALIFGLFITFYGAFFTYEKVVVSFIGIIITIVSLFFLKGKKRPRNQITINP